METQMPRVIYIQIEDDLGDLITESGDIGQCTWCVNKINDSDVRYILDPSNLSLEKHG